MTSFSIRILPTIDAQQIPSCSLGGAIEMSCSRIIANRNLSELTHGSLVVSGGWKEQRWKNDHAGLLEDLDSGVPSKSAARGGDLKCRSLLGLYK